MRHGEKKRGLGGPVLAVAALLGMVVLYPLPAWTDASGCTLHPNTSPAEDAQCTPPGGGCYFCIYSFTNQPGWTDCAESPDGSISYCVDDPLNRPQNQYGGSAASPAPRRQRQTAPAVISSPR